MLILSSTLSNGFQIENTSIYRRSFLLSEVKNFYIIGINLYVELELFHRFQTLKVRLL